MSDLSFRLMNLTFKVVDFFYPYIDKRIQTFGIRDGMTLVDYGCGPGRYTTRFAWLVGDKGKVYAVDIQELAIQKVREKVTRMGLTNIETVLARGYDSGLPDEVADMVFAIDMFFGIRNPKVFLGEIKRIVKKDGILVIDDGHQSRRETMRKIEEAGQWNIIEETKDHLICKPK